MYKTNNKMTKDTIVETPIELSKRIYKEVSRKPFKNILDIGSFKGNLSKPFKRKKNTKIIGLDVINEYSKEFDYFIHKDFLNSVKSDFKDLHIDLVVMNPPFQRHKEYKELYPSLFLNKVISLFGKDIPIIMIVGQWYLSNSNKRMKYLNDLNLTKIITLHKNVFFPINVESSVLFFNIKTKKSQEFFYIEKKKKKETQKFKSISLTQNQFNYIKKLDVDFTNLVKSMIKEKYKDFP